MPQISANRLDTFRETVCIGIPKTVDNDLAITDCSPDFGSAANNLPLRFARWRSMSQR